MRAFLAWFIPMAAVTVGVVVFFGGCYDPNHPPPCRPGSVDYPRCDPTQPPMPFQVQHAARDAGQDAARGQ
jgi:hypothetical protein